MANENRHIDIIEMDGASSRKIDDIRHLIEQTKYKPNIATFKIFIIDEVHMLTKEAFNALLKTLEEPPEYVKFILATTDPMKLPATILSRTQHFRFKKINDKEVVKHLEHILNLEDVQYEKDALKMITRAGNGSMRDTLTILDQSIIFSKRYIDTKNVASMLGLLDPAVLDNIMNAILNQDRKKIIEYILELENYECETIIDELISYLKEKFFSNDARFSTMLSDRFFRILSESKNLLFINSDSTFVLTLLFFKMMEATKIKEIDSMIEEIEQKITFATPKSEENSQIAPQQKNQTAPKEELTPKEPIKTDYTKDFDSLIEKLYDRNYELGECFKNNVSFKSYQNDEISLISCADNECRKSIREGYSVIRHFIQEIFGLSTKITVLPCDKPKTQEEPKATEPKTQEKPKETEVSTNSCVANQVLGEDRSKEIDSSNILEDPFIKKAGELFEPSKIIVKSKI
jgi:DNA polymerase-3 subunit gamma/tau